jgi:hypothetical protein
MTRRRRMTGRLRRRALLVLLGVVAMVGVLPAAPAFADSTLKPTNGDIGVVVGVSPKAPNKTQFPAGIIRVQFSDGSSGYAYCIEIARPLTFGVDYDEAHWDDTLIPANTLGTVSYILKAYGPDAGYTSHAQGMAVQSAIWHFTDGFTLDPAANAAEIVTLYNAIVAAAADPANTAPQPSPSLAINPASATGGQGTLIPFTVDGSNWAQPVALQVDAATPNGVSAALVQCTDGTTAVAQVSQPGTKVCLKLTGGDGTGQASFSAHTTGAVVPSGRAFVAQESTNTRQKINLSTSTRSEASAAAQAVFQVTVGNLTVEKGIAGTPPAGERYVIEVRQNGTAVASHEFPDADPGAEALRHTFTGLTAGTYQVVELPGTADKPNHATTVEITGGGTVTIQAGQTATATVTNNYTPTTTTTPTTSTGPPTTTNTGPQGPGSPGFEVRKDVDGGGGTGPFTFQVACPGATLAPGDAQFTLDVVAGNGIPNVHRLTSSVPVGTTCTVTETDRGGSTSTQIRVNEGSPRTFAVGATPSVDVPLRSDIVIAVRFTNFIPAGPVVPQQVPPTTPGPTPTVTGTLPLTGAGRTSHYGWPLAIGLLTLGASLLVGGRTLRHRTSLGRPH